MDILVSGQIVQILPLQQGVSQKTGQPWMTEQYIIEHESGQYPRRMVFDVKGQQRIQEMNLQVGEQVTLHLNIDCREYQGKYYNSIEAWKAERPGQQMVQQPMQGYAPQQGYQQMPPQQSPFPPQQPMVQGQQVQSPFPPQQAQVQQPAPGQAPFPPQPASQPAQQQAAPQNNGLPFQ